MKLDNKYIPEYHNGNEHMKKSFGRDRHPLSKSSHLGRLIGSYGLSSVENAAVLSGLHHVDKQYAADYFQRTCGNHFLNESCSRQSSRSGISSYSNRVLQRKGIFLNNDQLTSGARAWLANLNGEIKAQIIQYQQIADLNYNDHLRRLTEIIRLYDSYNSSGGTGEEELKIPQSQREFRDALDNEYRFVRRQIFLRDLTNMFLNPINLPQPPLPHMNHGNGGGDEPIPEERKSSTVGRNLLYVSSFHGSAIHEANNRVPIALRPPRRTISMDDILPGPSLPNRQSSGGGSALPPGTNPFLSDYSANNDKSGEEKDEEKEDE